MCKLFNSPPDHISFKTFVWNLSDLFLWNSKLKTPMEKPSWFCSHWILCAESYSPQQMPQILSKLCGFLQNASTGERNSFDITRSIVYNEL